MENLGSFLLDQVNTFAVAGGAVLIFLLIPCFLFSRARPLTVLFRSALYGIIPQPSEAELEVVAKTYFWLPATLYVFSFFTALLLLEAFVFVITGAPPVGITAYMVLGGVGGASALNESWLLRRIVGRKLYR